MLACWLNSTPHSGWKLRPRQPPESGDSSPIVRAHRVWSYGAAVQTEAGCAVDIGAEGADVHRLKLCKNLGPGMTEAVAASTGDDRPARRDGRQKGRMSGSHAAVMADLEQCALQGFSTVLRAGQDRVFLRPFGIALQQQRGSLIASLQHQRIVVCRLRAWMVIRAWRQHSKSQFAEAQGFSSAENSDRNVERSCLTQQSRVGCNGRIVANPKLARAEVSQNRRQTAHVIVMGVS